MPPRNTVTVRTKERKGIKVDLARRSEIGRERRKKKLLEILIKIVAFLADRSFDQTRIEEIAAASGVPTRTFYNYFQKKEDVAKAIDCLLYEIAAFSDQRQAPDGADTVEKVAFGMLASMNFGALEPEITLVSFDLFLSKYPDFQPFWTRSRHQFHSEYEKGVKKKIFLRLDAKLISDFVTTPLYFQVNRIAKTRASKKKEMMKESVILALAALGVERDKANESVKAMIPHLPSDESKAVQAAYERAVGQILN